MARDSFHEYPKSVLVGVGLALTVAAIFIVALRLILRRQMRVKIGIDDWIIVFAVVWCFSLPLASLESKEGGRGKLHLWLTCMVSRCCAQQPEWSWC